jgi:hypothetical protein
MAVTRVSSQIANGATLTMPSHAQYDLAIAIVYRFDSITEPTVPSGWRLRQSSTGNSNGLWIYERDMTSGSESFGTFTSASQVACVVYRSDASLLLTCAGSASTGQNSSTTINYPALGVGPLGNQNSFVLGAAGIAVNSSDGQTAPSGMTNITSVAGTSDGELTVHDTNAEVTSWTSTSFTASGAVKSRSITIGIQETVHPVPSGGGGETSFAYFG